MSCALVPLREQMSDKPLALARRLVACSDFQTHQLLSKLTRADSPTFHTFGKKPPADVLDLGCGEGFWVLHAAKLWKANSTHVVGFDLIDMHNNEGGEVNPNLEPEQSPKNVAWKRGNL